MSKENNKFTYTVELEQHTPILHFQHEHQGAAIRPTELKSKLDRFLYRYYFHENLTNHKHLLVGYGQKEWEDIPPFDYRVTIEATGLKDKYFFHTYLSNDNTKLVESQRYNINGKQQSVVPVGKAPYFADSELLKDKKDWKDVKLGLMYDKVVVRFFSLKTELIEILKKRFSNFLLLTNFGSRQSKGFGSFTVKDINVDEAKDIMAIYKNIFISQRGSNSISNLQFINTTYQKLKGGIPGQSDTSEIQAYYKEKKIGDRVIKWERKVIAEQLFPKANRNITRITAEPHERYIRALLGLAELHEYPQSEIPINKVEIKDEAGEIERFPSPLTFKVIGGNIYILVGEIPEILYDRTFIFEAKHRPPLHLKTPPSDKPLSLTNFLDDHLDKSDWEFFLS